MKKIILSTIIALIVALFYSGLFYDFLGLFKDVNGNTNWQYIANFSSSILIIILSITAAVLFLSRSETQKANNELKIIKQELEIRVKKRTANLDQTNQSLTEEIERHLATSDRLKVSEHYIHSILTSMPTMLVGLDTDGTITQWNEKAVQYTGVKITDAIGNNLWEAYPIITVSRDQVKEAQIKQEPTIIRQNQRGLFHFDITIYPLQGTGESGVVLLIDDVSKQVKSENKLIQRDMMSSMGELASSMANDMNVPLQHMINHITEIDSLVGDDTNENLKSLINNATLDGKQASAIVDNLLTFASSAKDDRQDANMTDIIDHSIGLAMSILSLPSGINFSDITIKRDYDENLPLVNCNVSEIQQVFLSLLRHCYYSINNKVDNDDYKPTIIVRIQESYDALWMKVSHNGVGLTSDEQQAIFEPFFSNAPLDTKDDADKRLSFSHFVITEHHYGQMAVTSDINVGTTFHMEFQTV